MTFPKIAEWKGVVGVMEEILAGDIITHEEAKFASFY